MKTPLFFCKTVLFCTILFCASNIIAQTNCIDTAISFNGNNEYLELPSNDDVSSNFLSTLTGDYTIECLLNWNGGAAYQRIFDFSFGSDTYFIFLTPFGNSAGAPRFAISSTGLSSPQIVDATVPLTTGAYHHLAVTYSQSASLVTIFIDGINVGSGTVNINAGDIYTGTDAHNQSINYLGLSSFAGDPQLNGIIDEFRISNVVRYTGNFTPSLPFSTDANTVVLYHFNEGSGQVAYDSSGNGYDAELGSTIAADANDPAWVNCEGTLPVAITNFTGEDVKGLSQLGWTASTEINSSYFEVQRSTDGNSFSLAGTVNAAANSAIKTNYSFTDEHTTQGKNYYRLKGVDLNGNFSYSKTILVNVNENEGLKIYPTITTGTLNVVTPSPETLVIYNMMGVAVKQLKVTGMSESVDVSAFPAGNYVVKAIGSSDSKTFVKQ